METIGIGAIALIVAGVAAIAAYAYGFGVLASVYVLWAGIAACAAGCALGVYQLVKRGSKKTLPGRPT